MPAAGIALLALLATGYAALAPLRRGFVAMVAVTFLIPVFGLLFGVVLLGEPVGVGTLVGFGIILYSVALVTEVRLSGAKVEGDHPPSRG